MEMKVSTGTAPIDWLLEGGYERDVVTTIYGPAGSGKTNLCLLCLANSVRDKKTIYIDTEGSFSVARLKQIADDYQDVLSRVVLLNPVNFEEQQKVFYKLRRLVNEKIGLIVLDSVAMLYRLELGQTKEIYRVNKALGAQLAYLTEIARKRMIPILITNQVYSDFDDKSKVSMVGGDILKYGSKCLIELQKTPQGRVAILRKHRSLPDGKSVSFRIKDTGIEELDDHSA
ncbi:MAG: DNA repair and recombination protein RadB [Nanoarchaeota archaeon]